MTEDSHHTTTTHTTPENTLTDQEAKIYDRQLRLWGIRTQSEMRKHKLLIYGLDGLCCEMLKNLVLAGVGSVCIADDAKVTQDDLAAQFFLTQEDLGKNRAEASLARIQELNPLVKVEVKNMHVSSFDRDFLSQYNSVSLHGCTLQEQKNVAAICRELRIQFFSSEVFGMYALCFQDLGPNFQYTLKDSPKMKVRYSTTYQADFASFLDVHDSTDWSKVNRLSSVWIGLTTLQYYREKYGHYPQEDEYQQLKDFSTQFLSDHKLKSDALSDEQLKSFMNNAGSAINPVCAIVGGVLAQEVIKSLSRDASPILNYFVFDAVDSFSGFIESIGVEGEKKVKRELISDARKEEDKKKDASNTDNAISIDE